MGYIFAVFALALAALFAYHMYGRRPKAEDDLPNTYFDDDEEDDDWDGMFDPHNLRTSSDLNNFYDYDVDDE